MLQEFMEFAELRKKIPVMALAISSFGKISGKLSKNDVMRAANKVCHKDFSFSLLIPPDRNKLVTILFGNDIPVTILCADLPCSSIG